MNRPSIGIDSEDLVMTGAGHEWRARKAGVTEMLRLWPSEGLESGPDPFHIVMFEDRFWLVPDEVRGIEDVARALPSRVRHRSGHVLGLPWALRRTGPLGLRWLPEPGIGEFEKSRLPEIAFEGVADATG